MKNLRSRLTFSNVVAVSALFIALGGSAYAATQLKKNSVGTKQIKNNAVTEAKIKGGSVTSSKLAPGAVTGSTVAAGSLTGANIQPGSLTGSSINQASLTAVRASNVMGIAISGNANCAPALPLPSGVTSQRVGTGDCKITFPNPVTNCTATVSPHIRDATIVILALRTAEEFNFASEPNSLQIHTSAESSPSNEPFDLVVVC